jgi:hypothetical protein
LVAEIPYSSPKAKITTTTKNKNRQASILTDKREEIELENKPLNFIFRQK